MGKFLCTKVCRVNVSLSNFIDMLIDYPNSKTYAGGMLDKLLLINLIDIDQLTRYKQHIENLEKMELY